MTLKNFTRRRLLLQRFGDFTIALLQFFEQPDVLDGDHGLVGEGLEVADLRLRERVGPRCDCDSDQSDPPADAAARPRRYG